jgi:hypothetical protein
VAKNQQTISLNGRKYDAVTGDVVRDVAPAKKVAAATATKPVAHVSQAASHHPKSVDGFRPPQRVPRAAAAQVKAVSLHKAAKPHHADVRPVVASKHPVQHTKAHATQRAHTLMRSSVKKPAHPFKRHANPQMRTDILAKVPEHVLTPKKSWHTIDSRREKMAQHITKSKLVSRFGAGQPSLPPHATAAVMQHARTTKYNAATDIKPTHPIHHDKHSMDIFEQALQRATSHTQKAPGKHELKKARKTKHVNRIASISATLAAIVVLAGFIAYQNSAAINMKVASSRAGISAHMPGYKPSGFAVSRFTYSAGSVAVKFTSNSDNRSFQVTQASSSWDSNALANEYVANVSPDYKSFQNAGLTIYTYGKDNATWVSNGIWYNVVSNGGLSSRELLSLAESL